MVKKNIFLFVILNILCCVAVNAQTQQGRVKTRGRLNPDGTVRAGQGIVGASMTFGNGSTAVSGNNGIFSFVTKEGIFMLKNVQKNGYQLCDRDLLGRSNKYSPNTFEIAMQTPDEALEDRLESEEKIRATLTAQLNKQKAELKRLKEDLKISQQDYNTRLQELYAAQSENEKLISEMAERYSSIDFDQMDDFQRRIAAFIQNGELIRADSLLNTKGSMEERSAEIDHLREVNACERKKLEASEKMLDALLADFAADCYNKYDICYFSGKIDSALYWLETRAKKDTMQIEWQLDAGNHIYWKTHDYPKARKYYFIGLNACNMKYGENSPHKIDILKKIAYSYCRQKQHQVAIEYYQKIITLITQNYGENAIDLAEIYRSIGLEYFEQHKFTQAENFEKKALSIFVMINGEERADYKKWGYSCYEFLGDIKWKMKDYKSALDYYSKALSLYEANNDESPILHSRIGNCFLALKEYDKAVEAKLSCLNCYVRKKGDHLDIIADTYNDIGWIYDYWIGDKASAIEYYQKGIDILSSKCAENKITISWYNKIASNYEFMHDYHNAIDNYQKALHINIIINGEIHEEVAKNYEKIGRAYLGCYNFIKADSMYVNYAIDFFHKALNIKKALYGDCHQDVASLYSRIGDAYNTKKDYVNCIEYYRKDLETTIAIGGENCIDVAYKYNYIAIIYELIKDYYHAIEFYKKESEIRNIINDNKYNALEICYRNIGKLFNSIQDYSNSQIYYLKEMALLKSRDSKEWEKADIYKRIGNIYELQENYAVALDYYRNLLELEDNVYSILYERILERLNQKMSDTAGANEVQD